MMHRSHQVTATAEAGADESMHGQESLCRPGSFAPAQVSRAVPCGLMGDPTPGQGEPTWPRRRHQPCRAAEEPRWARDRIPSDSYEEGQPCPAPSGHARRPLQSPSGRSPPPSIP